VADTTVNASVDSSLSVQNGLWGPYWSDISTGVIITLNAGFDLIAERTTNKGANWSTIALQGASITTQWIDVWYDRETPGDTGNLVHVVYLESDNDIFHYRTIDVTDGTVGTERSIATGLTVAGTSNNRTALTKCVNGNLLAAFTTDTEEDCLRSTDGGVNWTSRASPIESLTEDDHILFFPADVDAGDAVCLFWDASATEITMKMYDDSADTWTEFATAVLTSMNLTPARTLWDGSVRHSDKHILMCAWNDEDTANTDVKTADMTVDSIASPSRTVKANVVTNLNESGMSTAMWINQQSDEVRVAYIKGTTFAVALDVVFRISTDGMGTWGDEQAYSEATADDLRLVAAGRTGDDDGGRFQPSWFNDDLNDIFVNEVNGAEIAPAAAGTSLSFPQRRRNQRIMVVR